MRLTEEEQNLLSARVTGLETRTGTQAVAAVIGRSDSYAEAPWKAFALGAALAALYCAARSLIAYEWEAGETALRHAVVILGSGAFLALLAVLLEPFARLFTDRRRRDLEVTQYAKALFFDRGSTAPEAVWHSDTGEPVRAQGRHSCRRRVRGTYRPRRLAALDDRMTLLLSRGYVRERCTPGGRPEALLLARGYRVEESAANELRTRYCS